MEEKSMIPMEEVKERKVEIVKDINSAAESEKEIADKKEQERKERICLIQLITAFCTWVFLIILLMRYEKKEMQKKNTLSKPANSPSQKDQKKEKTPKSSTSAHSTKTPDSKIEHPNGSGGSENKPEKEKNQQQHEKEKRHEKEKKHEHNTKNYL